MRFNSSGFSSTRTQHDLVAELAAFLGDRPILIVEVKAMSGATSIAADWLVGLLVGLEDRNGHHIPFGMVVDLDDILVFDITKADPSVPVCRFKTPDILEAFDPDFSRKRIFDDYLLALVGSWLKEFEWRRRMAIPPGLKEFEEIGLAALLVQSSIHRKVPFADADLVRRDEFPDESRHGSRREDG